MVQSPQLRPLMAAMMLQGGPLLSLPPAEFGIMNGTGGVVVGKAGLWSPK